jgi:2-oxoglutarate ferredoxin oxidoreductase subunit delta
LGIKISVDEHLCKGTDGCGLCMHVCPKNVYDKSEHLTKWGVKAPDPVRIADCNGCNMCMIYCPDLAIVIEKTEESI